MKEDILTRPPLFDYFEKLAVTDPQQFDQVIRSRRSVRVFTEDKVPDEVIETALEHGLLAPNSSNLQSWKFLWVNSEESKKACVEACLNQSAARTAQTFIIAIARRDNWSDIKDKMIHKLTEEEAPASALSYYKKLVPIVYNQGPLGIFGLIKKIIIFFRGLSKPTPRGPSSISDMRVWAHKTCALACENIMLSLVSQGHDSCPMEGFDEAMIRKHFSKHFSSGDEVCMILGIGKRAHGGIYGPQVRMDSSQFIEKV